MNMEFRAVVSFENRVSWRRGCAHERESSSSTWTFMHEDQAACFYPPLGIDLLGNSGAYVGLCIGPRIGSIRRWPSV